MHNAKGIALKIRARLGAQISRACSGSIVPPAFLAGLISVENAQLNPNATRFEKAVYEKLKKLRNPLIFWRRSWSGITQADLKGASDEALANLATSFGYTQIMGWWSIHLECTVADIRDPDKHLAIAVKLLAMNATRYLVTRRFDDVLRIWNTGSPTGQTYHKNYVPNARAVMREYERLLILESFPPPRKTNDAPSASQSPASSQSNPAGKT